MQAVGPSLTPSVPYDDPSAAVTWLAEVLTFTATHVFRDPSGLVTFAQLVWDTGVVFVSGRASADNPWSVVGPSSISLAAADEAAVDDLYQRALAARADVVRPPQRSRTPLFPDGSYQFDVRDPEGNLWTVGTFRPSGGG